MQDYLLQAFWHLATKRWQHGLKPGGRLGQVLADRTGRSLTVAEVGQQAIEVAEDAVECENGSAPTIDRTCSNATINKTGFDPCPASKAGSTSPGMTAGERDLG